MLITAYVALPVTDILQYMIKTMRTPESLWLMRKQFAIQAAANMFLTYMCCLHGRAPSRFQLSRKTGGMYMTEILPGTYSGKCTKWASRLTYPLSHILKQPNHLVLRVCAIQINAEHAALHHSNRCRRHSFSSPHGVIQVSHSPRV